MNPTDRAPILTEPAHDILGVSGSLDPFFTPRSVAVIGATETPGSVGRTVLRNLVGNPFGGTVYPVNPKRRSVLGIRSYPVVADIPEPVDLAVVVTPAPTVPGVVKQCVEAGVRAAIIISAGFKELGPEGAELERQVLAEARRGRMRLIGPNCLGVMNPSAGLNATFAAGIARPGNVAFLSQSGALLTAILDWSQRELVGFSAIVSVGSMLDVGWGDLIDHLGTDPRTKAILIYMEAIGDARAFLSAAREVALTKPIIVIKAGRTEAAAKAAMSHTGSLAGSDEALEAAFRRCGVLRVERIADLFHMAEVLAKQPRPRGPRLAIVTNAGGPGVLATDALLAGGGALAPLAPDTIAALDAILPPHWSHGNPIDVLGDAGPDRYARALEVAARDPNSDGLLVILTPQDMTDPTRTAQALEAYGNGRDRPVLASWMGGPSVQAGEAILNGAGVPTFAYPDAAVRAFNYMWRYSDNLRLLYETPALPIENPEARAGRARVEAVVSAARAEGRTLLTEAESKEVLLAYGVPTIETRVAATEDEAVLAAQQIGYTVVLKLHSRTITHKTDVGGVKLDLSNEEVVRRAYRNIQASVERMAGPGHFQGVTVQPMIPREGYELILGSSVDPQLGPVLLFGSGGQLVEVYRDRSLAIPPLTTTLARRLMERTRIYRALEGIRGRGPVDRAALEQLLVHFGNLVIEQPWIREIDINPLFVSETRILALDARVVLFDPATRAEDLPRPAIRPYPSQYVTTWAMREGTEVVLRPIRPEDEPLLVQFHETLSERSVALRYLQLMRLDRRVEHERLIRVCHSDYDRDLALVVDRRDPETGKHEILGVGRLARTPGANEAEFALLISDRWQGKGLGSELLRRLLSIAREERIARVVGSISTENHEMQRICERLGFRLKREMGESLVDAVIDLRE
ncbi:bifunctional acetate--CoA ligase family protein/GNAT family N-acetyltransferase [Polyangium aurulentum]|uniref:bifunctional acetate--CoA ligase family protein/GNAT family N-acetyltransferase n=1 Tax=Polyangium aurulentum TaxID=2567896 RepID=UPI001F3E0461|nr:bifunctional acetate--CoA ligase family protein/GNAT family N-acetyltransferase [Polyangium aurulentum]